MGSCAQKADAGFTFIEMMMVIAIIGILTAVGIPEFQKKIRNQQLNQAAIGTYGLFQFAKSEAIRRSCGLEVVVDQDANGNLKQSLSIIQRGSGMNPDQVIRSYSIPGSVAISPSHTTRLSFAYNNRGMLFGGNGAVAFTNGNGGDRKVTVAAPGKVCIEGVVQAASEDENA